MRQLFYNRTKQRGRDRQIVRRSLSAVDFLAERLEGRRVCIVAVDIPQQTAQLLESRSIDSAVFLEAVERPGSELVEVPASLGNADDRYIEMAAFEHRLQRGKDFLVGQIARCAEEDQR